MKKIYLLLFFYSFCGYAQRESRMIPPEVLHFPENFQNHEPLVFTQEALENKYLEAKNYQFYSILKQQFLNSLNPNSKIVQLVSIDLENINVYETNEMLSVTYKVSIGDDVFNDEGEPLIVYNLTHLTSDFKNYHFGLFRYDFSEISYHEFKLNPSNYEKVLLLIPITEIGNIYENIAYSFAKELLLYPDLYPENAPLYSEMIEFAKCSEMITIPAKPCQVCGLHFYELKDGAYCKHRDPKVAPVPSYSYLELSPCDKNIPKKQ